MEIRSDLPRRRKEKQKMTKEFRAKFHAKGFEVGKDVSWGEWQAAIAEFVSMQNAYAEISNQYLDQLNQTWSQY